MLTGHSQNSGLGRALPLIERTRPPYWVALDPDPADAQRAAPFTRLIMRRHHRFDFGDGAVRAAMGATPAAVAREFVADCQRQPWYPFAWAIMTPPAMAVPDSPADLLAWAIEFQAACVQLFAAKGRECFVCNVPTGNDGYAVPGASWYMAQEYWWPGGFDDRLRYRRWFPDVLAQQPDAKLLIGECGATALRAVPVPQTWGAPHGADVGWRGGYGIEGMGEEAFAAQLSDYSGQLASDPYVLGAAVFQVGGNEDWQSFEILGSGIEALLEMQTWERPAVTETEGSDVAEFVLGFKDVADRLGRDVVGEPEANERTLKGPDGGVVLAVQPTTAGFMLYVPGGQPGFLPARR